CGDGIARATPHGVARMQLGEIIALALKGAAARMRRYVLACVACAILAIVAILEMTAAVVLALEPHLGGVFARLAVAGILALGLVVIRVALHIRRRARGTARATPAAQAQSVPMATLLEVFLLGYSFGQRLPDRKREPRQ